MNSAPNVSSLLCHQVTSPIRTCARTASATEWLLLPLWSDLPGVGAADVRSAACWRAGYRAPAWRAARMLSGVLATTAQAAGGTPSS
jgi:hypothetical protein